MDERSHLDEIRDLLEGTLPPEREAALRALAARDPRVAEALERYVEAHALTAPAAVRPPACPVRFEEIEARLRPTAGRTRLLLAAAAMLLAAGGAFALLTLLDRQTPVPAPPAATGTLALRAIPVAADPALEPEPEIPEMLVRYRPVRDGRIQWLESLESAETVARVTDRPMLVFVHIATCPWCRNMEATALVDPEILRRVGVFVPVRLPFEQAPVRFEFPREWPWFGALDADGNVILAFPGRQGPAEMVPRLDDAARRASAPPADWKRLNDLVARLLAARQSERAGWLDDAVDEYVLLREQGPVGPVRVAARNGLARIERRARGALLAARMLATSEDGVQAALDSLDTELEAFAGTPYEADLRAVRDALASTGEFPDVAGLR